MFNRKYLLLDNSLSLLSVIFKEENYMNLQFSSDKLFQILDYLKNFNIEVVLYDGILNIGEFISFCEVILMEKKLIIPQKEKNL